MPPDEVTAAVARGWIAKADADLQAAELLLRAGPAGPSDAVAYLAQQCAEKSLKALLCARGQDVPRMHDVEALLTRADLWDGLELAVEESRMLTDYATVTRYPGDYEPVTNEEAAHSVELARRIRLAVLGQLPD